MSLIPLVDDEEAVARARRGPALVERGRELHYVRPGPVQQTTMAAGSIELF